jgi:hypothetical protein
MRQRASECLEIAGRASTPQIRKHFEDLARTWHKLADERLTFFIDPVSADGPASETREDAR